MNITPERWNTLSALLDEALELPPAARDIWLDSLGGARLAFREELRTLLGSLAQIETSDFLGTLPKFDSDPAAAPWEVAPGSAIGPYIVEAEIGRGGMGIVWRAHRADGTLKRTVALKCPRTDAHATELMKRFLLERDILAELEHPNIARLYDAGITLAGQPYVALEYVAGTALNQYCDSHRLDVDARLQLMQQVLAAVQYAHSHLVIHRDLKPSNILVAEDGQVRLLDFGVAKLLPAHSASGESATRFGERALTPDYAAPEHVAGGTVTTASDVYSLGVVLYELLTGQRPYRVKRGSIAEIEEAIVAADPIRPEKAQFTQAEAEARASSEAKLRRALAGDLGTVVLKALKKAPAERYATADALAQDLERCRRRQPVLAQPDSIAYRLKKFVTRNFWPVTAAAIALAAVLIGAAAFALEARIATTQRDRALALAARNEAVSEFLSDLVTQAGRSDTPMNVTDLITRSEQLVSLEYKTNPEHRAAVLDMLGEYYYGAGNPGKAIPLIEEALRATAQSKDVPLQDKLHCDHAIAMSKADRIEAAKQEIDQVLKSSDIDPLQAVVCLAYRGLIAQDLDAGPEALGYASRALALLQAQPHAPPLYEAALYENLGWDSHLMGKNQEADRYYTRAMSMYEAMGRGDGVDALTMRSNWAAISTNAGDPRAALVQIDAILAANAKLDPKSAAPPFLLSNRAGALERLGRYEEARRAYELCIDAGKQSRDDTVVVNCELGVASLLRISGDIRQAESAFTQAAKTADAAPLPASNVAAVRRLIERARLDLAERQYASARDNLTAAIGDRLTANSSVAALIDRAEAYLLSGDTGHALADARQALAIAQSLQGGKPFSHRVGEASLMLGRVLWTTGDRVGARQAVTAAVEQLRTPWTRNKFIWLTRGRG